MRDKTKKRIMAFIELSMAYLMFCIVYYIVAG